FGQKGERPTGASPPACERGSAPLRHPGLVERQRQLPERNGGRGTATGAQVAQHDLHMGGSDGVVIDSIRGFSLTGEGESWGGNCGGYADCLARTTAALANDSGAQRSRDFPWFGSNAGE